jgi:hypothetical protein
VTDNILFPKWNSLLLLNNWQCLNNKSNSINFLKLWIAPILVPCYSFNKKMPIFKRKLSKFDLIKWLWTWHVDWQKYSIEKIPFLRIQMCGLEVLDALSWKRVVLWKFEGLISDHGNFMLIIILSFDFSYLFYCIWLYSSCLKEQFWNFLSFHVPMFWLDVVT